MVNRRQFLRGDFRGKGSPVRPPWALEENRFLELCTVCNKCIDACEESILIKAGGNYPAVDFKRGECTFCKSCVDSCQSGALAYSETAWELALDISDSCLAKSSVVCSVCGEQCETRAIRFKPAPGCVAQPEISQLLCSGCGACIQYCPSQSITLLNEQNREGSSI